MRTQAGGEDGPLLPETVTGEGVRESGIEIRSVLDLAYRLSLPLDDTRYIRYAGFRCAATQVR